MVICKDQNDNDRGYDPVHIIHFCIPSDHIDLFLGMFGCLLGILDEEIVQVVRRFHGIVELALLLEIEVQATI